MPPSERGEAMIRYSGGDSEHDLFQRNSCSGITELFQACLVISEKVIILDQGLVSKSSVIPEYTFNDLLSMRDVYPQAAKTNQSALIDSWMIV
jgi:hypothetical protein